MKLLVASPIARNLLHHVEKSLLSTRNQWFTEVLHKKVLSLPLIVIFVAADGVQNSDEFLEDVSLDLLREVKPLFIAWQSIQSHHLPNCNDSEAWETIAQYGQPIIFSNLPSERTSKSDHGLVAMTRLFRLDRSFGDHCFFILLDLIHAQKHTLFYLHHLSNIWQIEQENIPIHTAAVERDGSVFLFSGKSGAGKSTIAALSRQVKGRIIDQDQVLIRKRSYGQYTADAWGYDVAACDSPVKAFFSIKQSQKDEIFPLSQIRVAQIMMKRFYDIAGYNLPTDAVKSAFTNLAAFTRAVPGFELHFRKSPDFWKLIDEVVV
jgi:hypothetical protein